MCERNRLRTLKGRLEGMQDWLKEGKEMKGKEGDWNE